MQKRDALWLAAAALWLCALPAQAQYPQLNLHEINFDMWCQEQQHLPPSRCDKRLPADDAAYQSYVNTIEKYETRELNREEREGHIERTIMHNNPIERPMPPSGGQPGFPP